MSTNRKVHRLKKNPFQPRRNLQAVGKSANCTYHNLHKWALDNVLNIQLQFLYTLFTCTWFHKCHYINQTSKMYSLQYTIYDVCNRDNKWYSMAHHVVCYWTNSGAYHLYVDFVDLGIKQHSLTNNNKMGDNSQHQHPTMMFHIPPFK